MEKVTFVQSYWGRPRARSGLSLKPVEILCACLNSAQIGKAAHKVAYFDDSAAKLITELGMLALYDEVLPLPVTHPVFADPKVSPRVHWSMGKIATLANLDHDGWVFHVDFDAFLNLRPLFALNALGDMRTSLFAMHQESPQWEGYRHNQERFSQFLSDSIDWSATPLNTGVYAYHSSNLHHYEFWNEMLDLISRISNSAHVPEPLIDFNDPHGPGKYFEEVVFVEQRYLAMRALEEGVAYFPMATEKGAGADSYGDCDYFKHLCCHTRHYGLRTSRFLAFAAWASKRLQNLGFQNWEILKNANIPYTLVTDPFTGQPFVI